MSSNESLANEIDRPQKRRIQRRHGACEPCRSSKTKCDGRMPCGACRSERRRQCPCVYSEKAMKLQQVTAEIRRKNESEKRQDEVATALSQDELQRISIEDLQDITLQPFSHLEDNELALPTTDQERSESSADIDSARMTYSLSVGATIEEFKRLKPARGYSAQVVARYHGSQSFEDSERVQQAQNAATPYTLAHSYQSSCSLDLHQDLSETQVLKSNLDAVDNLVKEGRLGQAWSDLGGILRHAQLCQEKPSKDPDSSISTTWRQLWNNILNMEAQIGLAIGRPICHVTAEVTRSKMTTGGVALEDTLEDTRLDLYQHIQGMLELKLSSPTAIRDFLERARDAINHEPFNQIGLCTTEGHSAAVRDLHLNTHLMFMLVYCRMASLCDLFSRDLTNGSWSESPAADIIRSLNLHQPRQKLAYCRKMFRSANFILDSFLSLHQHCANLTGQGWLRFHSAYSAAVILGIAKLRHEVEWHVTTDKLKHLEQVFSKLNQSHPHCCLFNVVSERLRDLNSVKEPASEATRYKHSGAKKRKRGAHVSVPASPESSTCNTLGTGSVSTSTATSPTLTAKRNTESVDDLVSNNPISHDQYARGLRQQPTDYPTESTSSTAFEDLQLGHLSFFEDNSGTYGQSNSSFTSTNGSITSGTSSATSFSEPDLPIVQGTDVAVDHPGPPFAYPFPHNIFHPPMAWNNTMYPMDAHSNPSVPLRSSGIPEYAANSSTVVRGARPRFDLHNDEHAEAPTSGSNNASPTQALSEGAMPPSRLSPSLQSQTVFDQNTNRATGQNFLLPVKAPVPGDNHSGMVRRPSVNRRVSDNTIQQPAPATENGAQVRSMDWHAASGVNASHHMAASLTNGNLSMSNLDHRPGINNVGQSGLQMSRSEQAPYIQQGSTHHIPRVMGHQMFPEQINYLNPVTGVFEQQQIHSHYHPAHVTPYTRYIISESGQIMESNVY